MGSGNVRVFWIYIFKVTGILLALGLRNKVMSFIYFYNNGKHLDSKTSRLE
jgi:hypothetical protein